MSKLMLTLLIAAVLLSGIALSGLRQTSAPHADAQFARIEARLEDAVQEAQRAAALARSTSQQLATATAAPRAHPATGAQRDGAPGVAKLAQTAAPVRSVTEHLQARFDAASDTAWTRTGKEALSELVAATLPAGSRVQSQDCHGRLCRLQVEHAESEQQAAFSDAITADPGWQGPLVVSRIDGQGTLVYLGEPGVDVAPDSDWLPPEMALSSAAQRTTGPGF